MDHPSGPAEISTPSGSLWCAGPLQVIVVRLADGGVRPLGHALGLKRNPRCENSPELPSRKPARIRSGCMTIHIDDVYSVAVFRIGCLDAPVESSDGVAGAGESRPHGIQPGGVGIPIDL